MNSTFTGINIASRGVYASQAAMSVVTNNISNVHTTGYSKQTVNQSTIGVAAVYGGHSILGNGTEVTSVGQLRDSRLDQRYWQENTRFGNWDKKANTLKEVESVFNTSSASSGFSTVFNKFYSSLESLEKSPDVNTRNAVKEDGQAICQYLHETSQKLTEIQKDENCAIKTTVDEINSGAGQIADLNSRISQAMAAGANTNELKDQRNVLIDKLSKLTDISVTEDKENKLTINIQGMTLVNGGEAKKLGVTPGGINSDMYRVTWQDTGEAFHVTGGQLQSEFDLRDGDGTNSTYKGIPYYMNQLDKYAQTFAEAFNEGILAGGSSPLYAGHAGGYKTDGVTTGIRFFSYNDTSSAELKQEIARDGVDPVYKKITATTISLSKDIEEDVDNIATSSSAGGADNAQNVEQLIKLLKDNNLFNKGTPEDFYNSIISTLATDSARAERSSTNATGIVKTINDCRTSVSGVDINEETASLTKYQQAYEANAKMVSVWGAIYGKTIDMVNG